MRSFFKPALILLCGLLVIALLVASILFFLPRDNTSFSFECFRVRLAVSGFLKDLERERYDEAFDAVSCVSAEDGSLLESSEDLRRVWVERVRALREGTEYTYLSDHSHLTVKKVNGAFQVSVTLSVMRQGYNDTFYSGGSAVTVVFDDGWKISSVSDYPVDLQTELEQAISGRFSAAELAGQ